MNKGLGKAGRLLPSPAMVVALLALFVALGGSAWAVSKVGTKQIKKNAVTGSKIRNNAVTGPKIKNGAVTTPEIKAGAVTASSLANGAVTTPKIGTGAVGAAKLADGAVGGSNISITTVLGTPVEISPSTSQIATASCPEGKAAVSAGYQSNSAEVFVYQHFVVGGTALIYAASPAGSSNPVQVTAQAVCI